VGGAAARPRWCVAARRYFETTRSLRVHRARGGICRVEVEHPLLVGIACRDAMVMSVRHAAGPFPQLIYGFLNGIESMHDQVIAEPVPGWIFAALNADVDEHEGLTQKARLHHPVGEVGIGIGEQIQTLLLPTLRGRPSAAFQAQREEDTSIPMIKKGWAPKRCFPPTARGSQDARSRSFMERSYRRAGDRPLLGLTVECAPGAGQDHAAVLTLC